MNQLEKRQARRMIRHGREAERILFELIDQLQQPNETTGDPHDWDAAMAAINCISAKMELMREYVKNTQRELHGTEDRY